MVGVDGSASSRRALAWAVAQAKLTGATVDAMTAWRYPVGIGGYDLAAVEVLDRMEHQELAAKTLNEAVLATPGACGQVTIRQRVVNDSPAHALLEAANGADLLVVGSRGHGDFTGLLLGSVSQQCAHYAPCPIVIIRDHGRVGFGDESE